MLARCFSTSGMDTATLEQIQRPFVRNGNYDGAGLGSIGSINGIFYYHQH